MTDGRKELLITYLAIFADNVGVDLLLAIAPPLDETTYTAQNHKAFIGDVLREKLRELDLLGC